jgi:hypothetical protein
LKPGAAALWGLTFPHRSLGAVNLATGAQQKLPVLRGTYQPMQTQVVAAQRPRLLAANYSCSTPGGHVPHRDTPLDPVRRLTSSVQCPGHPRTREYI